MPRRIPVLLLTAVFCGPLAAQAPQDPRDPAVLQQAFDGAMTCAAVTAVKADEVAQAERWLWENRSFAFGMLAAQFFSQARSEAMTGEQLDDALNKYANALLEMAPADRAGFETSCGSKYPGMDDLCKQNRCIHEGPPADAAG